MLRVAITGCGHWHLPLYLAPLLQTSAARVVGVSDPAPGAAQRVATEVGCRAFSDYRDLCASVRPDLVIALGRHCDMAEVGLFLIQEKIPFVLEKPCGVTVSQVTSLASAAAKNAAFAAVPLVWRQSQLCEFLLQCLHTDRLTDLSFRLIAGPPSRYLDAGCDWMLDPTLAGGGCTINLSVHFIDLFAHLVGSVPHLVTAAMSNAAFGLPIEDHSFLCIGDSNTTCMIETGYLYPAPSGVFDMRFSFRLDDKYVIAVGPDDVEVTDALRNSTRLGLKTTNMDHYPVFVHDVLDRVRDNRPPVAGLDAIRDALQIVEQAYAITSLQRREQNTERLGKEAR